MKGFKDSNNKFHPITQTKGVRKSRDQTAKTIGIRLKKDVKRKESLQDLIDWNVKHDRLDVEQVDVKWEISFNDSTDVFKFGSDQSLKDWLKQNKESILESEPENSTLRKARKCECHNTEKLCYIHEVRILPESKEIWEGNSPSARLKLLGREKGNAKIAKLKWEDVPDNKKLKFSTGIEDWSAKIG